MQVVVIVAEVVESVAGVVAVVTTTHVAAEGTVVAEEMCSQAQNYTRLSFLDYKLTTTGFIQCQRPLSLSISNTSLSICSQTCLASVQMKSNTGKLPHSH